MTRWKIFNALFAAVLIAAMGLASPASAQTAEELRRDARACEQEDGYLRALNQGAEAAVNRINAQRLAFYQMRAMEENVEVEAVAAIFAMEIQTQPNYRGC